MKDRREIIRQKQLEIKSLEDLKEAHLKQVMSLNREISALETQCKYHLDALEQETRIEKYKDLRGWIEKMNLNVPDEIKEMLEDDIKKVDERKLKEISKKETKCLTNISKQLQR